MQGETSFMESPQPSQQKSGTPWIWWVILLALMVWNAWVFWPKSQPELDIPYSVFLDQVNAGNVTRVRLQGSEIHGVFVKPMASPQSDQTLPQGPAAPAPTYADFRTTFPEVIGDQTLLPSLNAHHVEVNVDPPPSPWITLLLTSGLPLLLLVLMVLWMGGQAARSQSGIFNFGRMRARQRKIEDAPQVTFADVAGADEAKEGLSAVVDFLRNPQKYHLVGARIPRGVLLVGPPGTGKTLLARAVAGEAGVPFFNISASEFVEMFVGVGASRVRDLFVQAKGAGSAIVFIDELDAVGRRRGAGLGTVNDEREQTLNQLLVEMDGFDEQHGVIILAATNRPDVLDPALLRPGRFDQQITIGLPDRIGREGILRIHTRQLQLAPDVELHLLARTTTGSSGADLANLCNEAALIAAREGHSSVAMADFEEALDRLLLGARRTLLLNDRDRRIVACHEAGHALVAWLLPLADPVYKVSIIPHGRALGVTEQMPGEDSYNYSRADLLTRLAVMLGGRVAEEIVQGEITTGAENDLVEATRLARRMVTRWGMGSLGPMALSTDEEQPFLGYELAQGRDYSEETAAQIDRDVEQLLRDRSQVVGDLLKDARQKLDRLVNVLLKEETIDRDTLVEILGPRVIEAEEKVSSLMNTA